MKESTSTPIHADPDLVGLQLASKITGGKLYPLIGVEDFGFTLL